jgi:hypothetical protein
VLEWVRGMLQKAHVSFLQHMQDAARTCGALLPSCVLWNHCTKISVSLACSELEYAVIADFFFFAIESFSSVFFTFIVSFIRINNEKLRKCVAIYPRASRTRVLDTETCSLTDDRQS